MELPKGRLQTDSVPEDGWKPTAQLIYPVIPPPSLHVTLDGRVKYTVQDIKFTANASNLPMHCLFNFTVVVASPSGRTIHTGSRFLCETNDNGAAALSGNFRTAKEIGLYELSAQLFPASDDDNWNKFEDLFCTVKFAVNKNFQMDRRISTVQVFPASYLHVPKNGLELGAWGLACDKWTDNVYYTDSTASSVCKIDPMTLQSIPLATPKTAKEPLNDPRGMCVDEAHHRLIIADAGNRRIVFRDLDGVHRGSFGAPRHKYDPNSIFKFPNDVAVTRDGNLIAVTDQSKKKVFLFDKYGHLLGSTSLHMRKPRGVAFDVDERKIFVSDPGVGNVLEMSPKLNDIRHLFPPQSMGTPQGVHVDNSGTLMVCDVGRNCLTYTPPRTGKMNYKMFSVGNVQLGKPVNVTTDSSGQAIVLNRRGIMYKF